MALQTKTIEAVGAKGHHKFTLTVIEESIDDYNYSYITWKFAISPVVKGYDWSYSNTVPVTYTINVGSLTYSGNIMSYDGNSTWTMVVQENRQILHDADGTKTITCGFSVSDINKSFLPGACSVSENMVLTTIQRAATVGLVTHFSNDEDNPEVYYSNPAGDIVEELQLIMAQDVNGNYPIATRTPSKTGTYTTITLTDAERAILWDMSLNNNFTVYFVAKTKLRGEWFTRSSSAYPFSIINATPTIAPAVVDMNEVTSALTGDINTLVRYYSTAAVNVNPTFYKGAELYIAEIQNGAQLTREKVVAAFYEVAEPKFNFRIVDTRGNGIDDSYTAPFIEYIKPTCNQVVKMALDGETGAKFELTISGNYFNDTFGAVDNELVLEVRHSQNDGSMGEWIKLTDGLIPTFKGNTYELTTTITGGDYSKAYTFQCRASDKLGNAVSTEYTTRLVPVFDWSENDFNFNVPVSIKGETIADFVVDEGKVGMWNYKKWNSGVYEAWGGTPSATYDFDLIYYGQYYTYLTFDLPSGFTEVNCINITPFSGSGLMSASVNTISTNEVSIYLWGHTTELATFTLKLMFNVKGRWK